VLGGEQNFADNYPTLKKIDHEHWPHHIELAFGLEIRSKLNFKMVSKSMQAVIGSHTFFHIPNV
jgi:hypothetical protein